MTYNSGTAVNISRSSLSSSSSVFEVKRSEALGGGSQVEMRRWDLERARVARVKIVSASDGGMLSVGGTVERS